MKRATSRVMIHQQYLQCNFVIFLLLHYFFVTQNGALGKKSNVNNSLESNTTVHKENNSMRRRIYNLGSTFILW